MDKVSPAPTSTSSKAEKPNAQKNIILVRDIESDSTDEEYSDDENDDDMKVCVHCRRCFMSDADLIPHCVNTHFCDPSCFENCRPSQYERHHLLKSYRSLGLTVRALGRHLKLKKCEECPKVFVCHFDILAHATETHNTMKPYGCVSCEKKFDTTWNRSQHVKKAHGENNIPCKVCGELVSEICGIESHILKCNLKPYQCKLCSTRFASQASLQSHRKEHTSPVNRRKKRADRSPPETGSKDESYGKRRKEKDMNLKENGKESSGMRITRSSTRNKTSGGGPLPSGIKEKC